MKQDHVISGGSALSASTTNGRLTSGSRQHRVRPHADRLPVSTIADAGIAALVAEDICPEYAAFATTTSQAIAASGGHTGRMWNRTPKFGPFDHSQQRRCAT
jgi:hypothetical protein